MDDRRKSRRIDAFSEGLQVFNGVDGSILGTVCNISMGGVMLIARRQLFPDGILQLAIHPVDDSETDTIAMGVKVLWCSPANSPDEYWAGLQAIDIGSDDRARLEQLLERLAGISTS